jgi:predicted glycosyltransferase
MHDPGNSVNKAAYGEPKLTRNEISSRLFSRRWRIALYSPGMVGLGHMRRNLLIASTLTRFLPRSVILVLAEAREASAFPVPAGVDCLTLPAIRKSSDGQSQPRYLDLSIAELVEMRASVIDSALASFEPDVLIADHLPRGAFGELLPAVENLGKSGRTRFVLGLRDILEDPSAVHHEWLTTENCRVIEEYYSRIWVYGDPSIFSMADEYNLPENITSRIRYSGYLGQTRFNPSEAEFDLPTGRMMLCLMGGGQDGARLAEAFVQAQFPEDSFGVLLTGPYMPTEIRKRLRSLVRNQGRVRLLDFVNEPAPLLKRADRVIAMGGYNTVCEILSFDKPALIIPRAKNRPEQWIRADRFRQRGLIDMLLSDEISPVRISDWLTADLVPRSPVRSLIDFQGLDRLSDLLLEILTLPYEAPHLIQEAFR